MRNQSRTARSAGAIPPSPTAHLSAACETGRHAACRGLVVSLRYQGPCECGHHAPTTPEPAAA
jgi:hypothetical protein